MTPPLYVVTTAQLAGDEIVLDDTEGHHAAAARRLAPAERVDLTDGQGALVETTVRSRQRGGLTLTVQARHQLPRPRPRVVVVQALAKDKVEDAVAAMTEVGVDAFVPWAAERSVVRWDADRAARGLQRWRSAAREASKQSHRAWFPDVHEPVDLAGAAALVRAATLAVVLHETAERPLAGLTVPTDGDVVLVVGPEGGCTDREVAALEEAGARVCRLGDTVLRSTTAGLAAASVTLAAARWRRDG